MPFVADVMAPIHPRTSRPKDSSSMRRPTSGPRAFASTGLFQCSPPWRGSRQGSVARNRADTTSSVHQPAGVVEWHRVIVSEDIAGLSRRRHRALDEQRRAITTQSSARDDDAHAGRLSVDRSDLLAGLITTKRIGDVDARNGLNVLGFAPNRTIRSPEGYVEIMVP